MARAFLYPALARENVTLLVNTEVNRITIEGNVAVGVSCTLNGETSEFRADRDTILATDGFNTKAHDA